MLIVYDDMYEFAQVAIRCNDTARRGKCMYCPFYDRCRIAEEENRHVMCGELAKMDGERKDDG